MRAEVVSNHFLEGDDRLTRRQMSWLRSHGWNAPTGKVNRSTPDKDPGGSPNYYIDFPDPVNAGEISRIAIETLINGLGILHPARLAYKAFEANGKALSFDELGLKPAVIEGKPLMERVLEVFREVTGISDLERDRDGNVSIRYGPIVLCATPLENQLRLSTGLITGVVESPALLSKINQLNFGLREMPANPFVPKHLAAEIPEFTAVTEGLALLLRAEFSGDNTVRTGATSNFIQ